MAFLRRLPLGSSPLDVPPARGSCGVMVVSGGDSSSSSRWCAAPGAGVDVGAAAPCVEVASAVLVSVMVARATWSSTRFGAWPWGQRGALCCMVFGRFSL